MKLKPLTVLADDLTGACELAAIGHQWGLKTVVQTCLDEAAEEADLVVYDTETRLESPAVAATRLGGLCGQLGQQLPQRFLFKKTDSVIRGPIAAEIQALMEGLPFRRCLFLPANPGLGRTVLRGNYYINGVPLKETGFAHDLHHPAWSSVVRDLLGTDTNLAITELPAGGSMPGEGLIIGDAESDEDLEQWAARLDEETLAAGAASFFRAILKQERGPAPEQTGLPDTGGQTLLISGTTDPDQHALLDRLAAPGNPPVTHSLDQLDGKDNQGWAREVLERLENQGRCMAFVNQSIAPDPARAGLVRDSLARLAHQALAAGKVRHVIVEGGATAASICAAMGWTRFIVAHAWAQGIVSMRPLRQPELLFTIKPGSYAWPENFMPVIKETTPAKS